MRKHFLENIFFESITEIDNLDSAVVENVVAKTNDFYRHL